MTTLTTNGIVVSVESNYQADLSEAAEEKHIFVYHITIENRNHFSVQLLRRRWLIFDSNCIRYEVEGAGVVGEQPVMESGESYQYSSWCNLKTEMGKMRGTYILQNQLDESFFGVNIPEFELIAPQKMN